MIPQFRRNLKKKGAVIPPKPEELGGMTEK